MNLTLANGQLVITVLVQGILAFVFLGGLWFVVDKFTKFNDYEQIVEKNWSYLVQRIGMLIGALMGIGGSLNFSGRWSSIGMMAMGATWAVLVILFVYQFVERTLSASNPHEAHRDNMTVSLTKAAAYFTVGMVLLGSLSGSSPDGTTAIAATVAFTFLGLLMVPIAVWFHMRGLKRLRERGLKRYEDLDSTSQLASMKSLLEEARDGKRRAGFELAGALIALGFLLCNAIAGDFIGWWPGLISFGISFGIGFVLLYIYRIIGDKLMFRHTTVNDAQAVDMEGPAILLAILLPITAYLVSKMVIPIAGIFA